MIFVGEATAGPADHRHLQFLERGHDVVADSPRVRDRRAGAHPDAFVNPAPQMLGELAENVAIDPVPASSASIRIRTMSLS